MAITSWNPWWKHRSGYFSRGKASAESMRRQNAMRSRQLRGELLESRLLMATEINSLSSLTLNTASLTRIEIGGPVAGNPEGGTDFDGFDRIEIASDATLAGTLQVELVNGYVPNVGDEFLFMTSTGAFIDKFDQAQGLLLPDGERFFDIVVSGHQAKLVVKAVPGAGLRFTPSNSAAADDLGEFLGGYFDNSTLDYSGGVEVSGFFSADGMLTVERKFRRPRFPSKF
jgi:hypothetical protein